MVSLVEHLTITVPSEVSPELRHDRHSLGNEGAIKIPKRSRAASGGAVPLIAEWLVVAARADALEDRVGGGGGGSGGGGGGGGGGKGQTRESIEGGGVAGAVVAVAAAAFRLPSQPGCRTSHQFVSVQDKLGK